LAKTSIIFLVILLFSVCHSGCQKIREIFIRPSPEGVVESTYPVRVHAYQSSVVVNASPRELTDYISDITRLQESSRAMGLFQLKVKESALGRKELKVGQYTDITVKIMGISLPSRVMVFKYKPERDIWLMVFTRGTWALGRAEIEPVPGGSMINISAIGQTSRTLSSIVDTFQLADSVAARLDLWMAIIQSEFDPDLDVKELTGKGLRGELYDMFLQAHEASVWVAASPDDACQWIIRNMDQCLPEIRIKGDCSSYRVFEELSGDEIRHCPGKLKFLNLAVDVNTFLMRVKEGKESIHRIYLQGLDRMAYFQLGVSPEAGGSRVRCLVVMDIPESASPKLMDIMMAFVAMPKHVRDLILDIQSGLEGVG
jgi:hypothetical protein